MVLCGCFCGCICCAMKIAVYTAHAWPFHPPNNNTIPPPNNNTGGLQLTPPRPGPLHRSTSNGHAPPMEGAPLPGPHHHLPAPTPRYHHPRTTQCQRRVNTCIRQSQRSKFPCGGGWVGAPRACCGPGGPGVYAWSGASAFCAR